MEKNMNKFLIVISLTFSLFFLSGCAPEVGSKEWCAQMKEKPKGDWTANEAADFTKSCIF
tara:strand:- start:3453 stop:3632 length:180 start_codon:yes stop_codon:yes gene_type:complete